MKQKDIYNNILNEILSQLELIPEAYNQFVGRCEDGEYIEGYNIDDLLDVCVYTLNCFEEEDHYLYNGLNGYSTFNNDYLPNEDLKKQYKQLKKLINKIRNK